MKMIQDELGVGEDGSDYQKFKARIADFEFEGEILDAVENELEKFKLMDPSSSEYFVSRNYLELVCSLPWKDESKENYDLVRDYQDKQVNLESDLLEGLKDKIKKDIDNSKKLSSAIVNALKDLLDQVKRKLDERRKAEDNEKTETDISQKQQRLAMLRADTSSGHQVEIAQLEREIADAQQSYQRT